MPCGYLHDGTELSLEETPFGQGESQAPEVAAGVFGCEKGRPFVAAKVKRSDHQRSIFEGTSHLLVDLQLPLEAGTFVGFEKEELSAKQSDTQEIVHTDLFDFLRTANIGKQ